MNIFCLDFSESDFSVAYERNFKTLLVFATVYGKNTVTGQRFDFLGIFLVHFVHAQFFLVFLLGVERGSKRAVLEQIFAERFTKFGVVGNNLGDYVERAGNGVFFGFHSFFGVDVILGYNVYITLVLLRHDNIGERLQTLFDCNRRTRLFLLFIRAVNVFDFGQRFCIFERNRKFVRPLTLSFYAAADFFLSLFEIFKIGQSVVEIAQKFIVATAVHFLAVTRNKRNGVSFLYECDDIVGVRLFEIEFRSKL